MHPYTSKVNSKVGCRFTHAHMDYINSKFVSLRDLEDIDEHINTLNERKLDLTKAIQLKTEARQQEAPTDTHAKELVSSLHKLGTLGSLNYVDQLIEKYGKIKILDALREAIQKKLDLEKERAILLQASEIESRLNLLEGSFSVDAYARIADSIERLHDENLRLVLSQQLQSALEPLKLKLSNHLKTELEEIKWLMPQEKVRIPAEKFKLITRDFSDLIDIEGLTNPPVYPHCWHGLSILLHPFVVRFNYHFNKATETNRISRPEWALNYMETFVSQQYVVLELVIRSTFSKHGRIAIFEVLTTLLVPLREKLLQMVHSINSNIENAATENASVSLDRDGRLLSHLIFETASFDQRLRKNYKYNPYIDSLDQVSSRKWTGLTGDVLISSNGENSAVNNWLKLESRLADSRFESDIIGASNAFDIDYEFNASSENPNDVLKPSYSAYALVKLFDNLTTHFKSLSVAKYQLKYVSNIQLALLDKYYNSLEKKFRQFTDSLALMLISNFLPVSAKTDTNVHAQVISTNGLKGLEILTGLYCLIKFVVEKLEEWSNELVYIQLWNVYNSLSSGKKCEASIFDSTIVQYNSLLEKVQGKYEELFQREIRTVLKEYINSCTWIVEDDTKNQPSTQLTNFSIIIPSYMSYLKRTLPEIDYYLISTKVCDSFANTIQEYVISNNQFNKSGLKQLKTDLKCLNDYLKDYLMMDKNLKYSNARNRKYRKLFQSIRMMERFDAATAKLLKKNLQSNNDIRAEFEDGLNFLSDHEIRDLLFRIV